VANTVGTLLQGVVKNGTGKRAMLDPRIPVAGKTGTTENYGDAWFVGWTPEYTVAVWVGYPKKFQPMKTEFQGQPVAGGTFPAAIWKTFMESVFKIEPPPELKQDTTQQDALPGATAVPGAAATAASPVTPAPSTPQTQGGGTTAPAKPQNPAPAPPANNQPSAPAPSAPQQGGGQTAPSGGAAPPAGTG
jgi:penicillin-binding protein 1A